MHSLSEDAKTRTRSKNRYGSSISIGLFRAPPLAAPPTPPLMHSNSAFNRALAVFFSNAHIGHPIPRDIALYFDDRCVTTPLSELTRFSMDFPYTPSLWIACLWGWNSIFNLSQYGNTILRFTMWRAREGVRRRRVLGRADAGGAVTSVSQRKRTFSPPPTGFVSKKSVRFSSFCEQKWTCKMMDNVEFLKVELENDGLKFGRQSCSWKMMFWRNDGLPKSNNVTLRIDAPRNWWIGFKNCWKTLKWSIICSGKYCSVF